MSAGVEDADDGGLGPLTEPARGLREEAVRQGGVTVAGQVAKTVLQLGSTVVLARLLTPTDFGLIAMVAVVVAFIDLFRDVGLTQAVAQVRTITQAQASGLFWINAGATVVLALLTAAAAPLVASFYGEPRLTAVTVAFGAFLVLGGVGAQHQAILARRLRFGRIVSSEVAGHLLGIVAAVTLAATGAGYWALVALAGVRSLVTTVLLWILSEWRPDPPRRGTDIGELLRFGADVTGFRVANFLARSADNLLIGWRWGSAPLGLYSRAYAILTLPLTQINAPLSRVAIPTMARLRDEPERYRRAYLQVVRATTAVASPALAYAFVTSDWLIDVVLGAGWEGAASIFAWLAFAGMVQPLANTTGWLFVTQDRTDELWRWGLFASAMTVVSFVIGLPFGPTGVAAAYALMDVLLRTPLLLAFVGRRGPVSTRDLVGALAFPFALSLAVGLTAGAVRLASGELTSIVGLAATALPAGVVYLSLLAFTAPGRRVVTEAAGTLRRAR